MADNKLNIAFVYPSIGLGGQQTQTYELMKAIAAKGHSVYWLYQYGNALLNEVNRVGQVHKLFVPRYNKWKTGLGRITNRALYYEMTARQIGRYCRKHLIDAVITASTPDTIACNRVVSRINVSHFRSIGGSLRQVEPHYLERFADLKIDSGVNGYFGWPLTFDELRSVNVPEDKFHEMPFAVNTERFHPLSLTERLSKRASIGIEKDAFVIGWVGRIAINMQLWESLELVRHLHKSGRKTVKLLVLGGGDDESELRKRASLYGLKDHVHITGWIPYDEVNSFINCMDVIPLLESDPQGGSIVREAMAAGRVAISVDGSSGTQRWFMPEGAAILVSPENFLANAVAEVKRLMDRPADLAVIGSRARAHAESNMLFSSQAQVIIDAVSAQIR